MSAGLSDVELMLRVDKVVWFHSMELRLGVASVGPKTKEVLKREEETFLAPFDLTGRSVLDIGAWNGFFSFAAKRRGATRVLATDHFAWRHSVYRGREGFDLARAEFGLDVETMEIDPTAITGTLGRFDVVLFLGVFYHLHDPIDVMQRLREVTGQLLLVETHQDALHRTDPAMVFYPGAELHKDSTNWWGPNPAMMLRLLLQLGFSRIFYRDHPIYGRARGIYAAFTNETQTSLVRDLDSSWRDLDVPGAVEDLAARS